MFRKEKLILWDILRNERIFSREIKVVENEIIPNFLKEKKNEEGLNNNNNNNNNTNNIEVQLEKIFCQPYLSELIHSHDNFSEYISNKIRNWNDETSNLMDIVENSEELIKTHGRFTQNFDDSIINLQNYLKENHNNNNPH